MMNEALRELMRPEIEEELQMGCKRAHAEGHAEGLAEGRALERTSLLVGLVDDGTLPIEKAAKRMAMTVDEFKAVMKKLQG